MSIINQEELNNRIKSLGQYNGIKLVLVFIPSGLNPDHAVLEVYFYNKNALQKILDDYTADPDQTRKVFAISGGQRIIGGRLDDQIQVTQITGNVAKKKLELTVAPIGDYSTYTLAINELSAYKIDPLLSEITFKFRPACFSADCAPDWDMLPKQATQPLIDYLSKDYNSFRHMMIAAMKERVTDWEPTSEADLDMVLMELFSVRADELSDYQDRVMSEAYLTSARKRVSLARHARLMDYQIHQGQQANTWVAAKLIAGQQIDFGLDEHEKPEETITLWTGHEEPDFDSQFFITKSSCFMDAFVNEIKLYSWDGVKPTLACGSTSADLLLSDPTQTKVEQVRDWINEGKVQSLLIQESKNPETGTEGIVNPNHRQMIRLKTNAVAQKDPITDVWYLRIEWEQEDALTWNATFYKQIEEAVPSEDITLFHGNLIRVYHGQLKTLSFKSAEEPLADSTEKHYELTKWGAVCELDDQDVLAYKKTVLGNQVPAYSTLDVKVTTSGSGIEQYWKEKITLVKSTEEDEHFMVETDEDQKSIIRFGNGINGKTLPEESIITCTYQIGQGISGNIGCDSLLNNDHVKIESCWNPFDVTTGLDPEPTAEIIRRVQEAYLARQFRAITLEDYEKRAMELKSVSNAKARYQWSGSWRIVRLAIDPIGGYAEREKIRKAVAEALEPVRLIGDDLEVRLPHYVPLDIKVAICIDPDYWIEDIRYLLEQEFSVGYTQDGRKGFFHPDGWTFGQNLLASQILGRVQSVKGIGHVRSLEMKRFNEVTPGKPDRIEVQIHEIIQVENDPDHQEKGVIAFDIKGGRQ
ncbi:baseplate J/gp47 family protein [bacterium]|nr:baseplate J/gp47 family protein [bacterium]